MSQGDFYITVSNTAFKKEIPTNTSTSFRYLLKNVLDLRKGYSVAVASQVLYNPISVSNTIYHVTSNLVEPRLCERTCLAILRTGKLTDKIETLQFIPCVPGQFETIDIKLERIAGAEIGADQTCQITLLFRENKDCDCNIDCC